MSHPLPYTRYEHNIQIENTVFRLLFHPKGSPEEDEYNSPLTLTMHSHASGELFACGRGHLYIAFAGGMLTLYEGDAAIIPSGLLHHSYPLSQGSETNVVSFMCHKRHMREGAEYKDIYAQLAPLAEGDRIMVFRQCPRIFDTLTEIMTAAPENADSILPALHMVELLLSILSYPHEALCLADIDASAPSRINDVQRMMALDDLLSQFSNRELRAESIAAYLFVSTRQLDRIVRKRYGKTLHAVIMDRRIDAAEQLLRTTDMTIDAIGECVGFSSRSGFYREFSRRYGTTPALYRKHGDTRLSSQKETP